MEIFFTCRASGNSGRYHDFRKKGAAVLRPYNQLFDATVNFGRWDIVLFY
jgi:hypothetical protein